MELLKSDTHGTMKQSRRCNSTSETHIPVSPRTIAVDYPLYQPGRRNKSKKEKLIYALKHLLPPGGPPARTMKWSAETICQRIEADNVPDRFAKCA